VPCNGMVRVKVYCKLYTKQDVQKALNYLHVGHTKNVSLVADFLVSSMAPFIIAGLAILSLLNNLRFLNSISH
jgi:hypothetical protein